MNAAFQIFIDGFRGVFQGGGGLVVVGHFGEELVDHQKLMQLIEGCFDGRERCFGRT